VPGYAAVIDSPRLGKAGTIVFALSRRWIKLVAPQTASASKIWAGGFYPLALVVGWGGLTAILSLLFFKALEDSRARVRGTHDVLLALNGVLAAATDAETGQRGYLITQKDAYLTPYRDGLKAGQSHLNLLVSLRAGNAQQSALTAKLKALWIERSQSLNQTIGIAHTQGFEAARAAVSSDHGKEIMDRLRLTVSEIEAIENVTRADALADADAAARRFFAFNLIAALMGFAALLYLLSQARRAAEELQAEVSTRQSAEELARERADQAIRMRIMNRELVHRTKNLISVVQAIVRNQEKGSPEIDRYSTGLSNRLVSLGSTLDILVRENWNQVTLQDLIAGQLGHFSENIGRRIVVSPGPPINFTASEAQMIGLALHELGTNAAKYGALSRDEGSVDIRWLEEPGAEGPAIVLSWTERNGPPVEPPSRRGFGSRLTESLVARAVGGTAAIDFNPSGLVWTLTFLQDRNEPDDISAETGEPAASNAAE
jgi:two-component sensor histidine kinase/CHASE3 domain sensor protein